MINYSEVLMGRKEPLYSLHDVQERAERGDIRITGRVRRFLQNRYDGEDPTEIVCEVVRSIEKGDYYKTDELEVRPGVFADIYRHVHCDEYAEEDWYVKLFVMNDETNVDIFSCNWEGYIH